MKYFLLAAAALFAASIMTNAQGKFETVELKNSTLHVYYSNDVMADASFIVEGRNALVTLEAPLFKSGLYEFNSYIVKLGKPLECAIVDYHQGQHEGENVVMPEGMDKFTREGVYAAMMGGFRQSFGDTMVEVSNGKVREIPFGESVKLAGVEFYIGRGPANDFPASVIVIDGSACLMHWAPMKAHANNLQISSAEAVAQAIDGLETASKTGVEIFLGSHGGVSDRAGLEFRLSYLRKIQELLSSKPSAREFASKLKAAYPGLAGEEGVDALAEALCK